MKTYITQDNDKVTTDNNGQVISITAYSGPKIYGSFVDTFGGSAALYYGESVGYVKDVSLVKGSSDIILVKEIPLTSEE